eukprot:m.309701 g.309701  ORF g.309701 m.309701 type:complete len:178 (+) comp16371_c1_seq16:5132-5665(+)
MNCAASDLPRRAATQETFGKSTLASTAPDRKGYFVNAATGDDTASGTEAQPLKTLTRALERVAAGVSGRTRTVTLRGGVHRLLETVEMTHVHSHTVLTQYCAGNGTPCETAWLSGGVELPGLQWSLFDPSRNVWRARLEATTPSVAAAIIAGALRPSSREVGHRRRAPGGPSTARSR